MRDHTLGTVIIGRSVTSNALGIKVASEQVAPLAGQVLETHTVSVGVAISVSYAPIHSALVAPRQLLPSQVWWHGSL
jgi:hypothetical protein